MSNLILVRIILPSMIVLESEAELVNIPGSEGVFGVLPNHCKLISDLDIGVVTLFSSSKEEHKYFVYGGIAQVNGLELNIVSEFAVNLDKISKITVREKITSLKSELDDIENETIEADIILDKIEKYQALLSFI